MNVRPGLVTLLCAAVLLAFVLSSASSQDTTKATPKSLEGNWQGTLKVGGMELRLVFKVASKSDGTLTAKMDSPDQGAKDIALDEATLKDGAVKLGLKVAGAAFEGKLNAEATELVGEWKQGGAALPLTLKRVEKVAELVRPQMPKKPYPYVEEDVVYENTKAGTKLGGTLTLPRASGPFPAVLLITGSGPQDRDETLMGHKPFLVLADYLTRKGIAVLRVDDRGVGKSTGKFDEATTLDFADDVEAGVAFLKTRKEINPKQIGLIGHSEGGVIAPIVAGRSKDIAFIVLMAGTGLTGEEILYLQGQLIMKASGASDEQLAFQKRLQEGMFKIIKAEADNAAAAKKLKQLIHDELTKLPEALQAQAKLGLPMIEAQIKRLQGPWMRWFLTFDPRTALVKVQCPVLAICGEKDLQVPPKENLTEIEKALRTAGNRDITIRELPKLNHLFQTCETGNVPEYSKIEETIAPVALELMAEWILKRTMAKKQGH